MEYKVIVIKTSGIMARDIEKGAADLSRQVNEALSMGWEPVGGVAISTHDVHMVQALVKRR